MKKRIVHDNNGMNVIILHSSIDDANLGVYAFRIYCHLARRSNGRYGEWTGPSSISKACGINFTEANEGMRELEDRGMIIEKKTDAATTYLLTSPEAWKTSEKKRSVRVMASVPEDSGPIPDPVTKISPSRLKEMWNSICTDLPKVREVTHARAKKACARGDEGMIESCLRKVQESDFLTGRQAGSGGRKFKADFDWIMKPDNFTKTMEGKYSNRKDQGSKIESETW